MVLHKKMLLAGEVFILMLHMLLTLVLVLMQTPIITEEYGSPVLIILLNIPLIILTLLLLEEKMHIVMGI